MGLAETIGWLLEPKRAACAGGAVEAKASILDLKVEARPELWPERFRKLEPQWSPTTKSGRSAVGL